jgi:tetratricopeptide (TPR) repeat protein
LRASSALQQAIKLKPTFAEAHYVLGLSLKDRGQFEQAREAFEKTVRLAPAMIPAREELADLHRLEGDLREELEQLEALAALDPRKAERFIAVGLAYLRAGKRELAVTTLGRAAERFHEHPGVYAALGQVWLQAAEDRGDPSDARKALKAIEPEAIQAGASSETLGLYGRALALLGETERAERAFRNAAQRLPIDPSILPQYAALAERLGHVEDARQALVRYSALVDDDRDEAEHAARIGDFSLALNDPSTAMIWYQKSDALTPGDATQLLRLAEAQWKSGHAQEARSTLARALAKDPENTTAQTLARRFATAAPTGQTR